MVRGGPGGILTALRTIERWGDFESDFQHHYGLDARGVWARPGSPEFFGVRRLYELIVRLPEESLSRTTPKVRLELAQNRAWTANHELLAQLLEMVSVVASEKTIKEPVTVPRPSWVKGGGGRGGGFGGAGAGVPGRNPYSDAITRMRAASAPRRR